MAVLDASFLIDLRGRRALALKALERLVATGEALLVPAQAAAEFVAGREDGVAALEDIERSYSVVPLGPRHVLEVARVARAARKAGRFLGWADAQIAAVALLEGTFIVTADVRDFRALGCAVWDYRRDSEPPDS